MFAFARDQLINFGFAETFLDEVMLSPELKSELEKGKGFIDAFNEESLKKSIHNAEESDEVTSIFINYPALLLRKKTEKYPNGRTSYRFKRELRKKVTIIDKTGGGAGEAPKEGK
jgi:hypothetical protein